MCSHIAQVFIKADIIPKVVAGPTVGEVVLSQWTAFGFNPNHSDILAVCADEEDVLEREEITNIKDLGEFFAQGNVKIDLKMDNIHLYGMKVTYYTKVGTIRAIKRGYGPLVSHQPCLVVEDVINTGATVSKTISAVKNLGGTVIGVGALCNRSGGKVTAESLGVPKLFSLLDFDMEMFPEDSCPICREKGPKSVRTDLGKGRDFLIRKGLI